MENNIQLFNYGELPVRTIEKNGQIWFVAKDICDILEYTNSRKAIDDHLDDDEKMTVTIGYSHSGKRGGAQKINVINESGMYALIFRSTMPKAKEFRKWVTSQVLPMIREKGYYSQESEQENLPAIVEEKKEVKQLQKKAPAIHSGNIKAAKEIFTAAGLAGKELAQALDDVYRYYTGESAIDIAGIALVEIPCEDFMLDCVDGKKGVWYITSKNEFGAPVKKEFFPMDVFRVMYDDCWPQGGPWPKY